MPVTDSPEKIYEFFRGLGYPEDVKKILAGAPYPNGGLFHRNDLDDLPFKISDTLFEEVFNFLEQYNFCGRGDL